MCVYNIKFMKAGIIMNYALKKTVENVAVMETAQIIFEYFSEYDLRIKINIIFIESL